MNDAQVRAEVVALDELVGELDERGTEAVAGLLRLYGEGLRRIVAALDGSPDVLRALARDELVAHLLLLHDLQPAGPEPVSPGIAFGPVVVR